MRILISGIIGALIGLAIAVYNGSISASPAQTEAGQIAYIAGLVAPSTVIGILIGFFTKNRKQPTMLDATGAAIFGKNARKTADLERSVTIANEDLLYDVVSLAIVKKHATDLYEGPMPYSTHDLATSTALSFYKKPELFEALEPYQLAARRRVLGWAEAGKLNRMVAYAFENTLYEKYHPNNKRP